MKLRTLITALFALLLTLPTTEAVAQRSRATDWTLRVEPTPEGGYRMGDPNAPVKIVEFISLTCPHCRAFSLTGMPHLIPMVRRGRVSIEYRNIVLNAPDVAAAMLSRCATPINYFRFSHDILAQQPQWIPRMDTLSAAQQSELQALEPLPRLARIVQLTGLDRMAQQHGIFAGRMRTCMSDQRGLDRVLAMQEAAAGLGVTRTPSFLINGRLQPNVHDWASLEPLVAQAR